MAKSESFEWDQRKNKLNQNKHGISFEKAQLAFSDRNRIIAKDLEHSKGEERYYCFGQVGEHIVTVRFTYRINKIRITNEKLDDIAIAIEKASYQ